MTITGKLYGLAMQSAFNKEIDWDTDTINCMLVGAGYTPNQDTHRYKSDLGANELTGTGYSAGGAAIANRTFTYTGATNTLMLDGDDVTWAASTITLPANGSAIVYDNTPATDATRPLICYQQTDTQIASTNGNFVVQWNASGIVSVVVS